MDFSTIKGVIFDYGGTLDTNGRHWAYVLWEGYVSANIPITEEAFRDAYVSGERALAKEPIVCPEDNFHTVLVKKVREEMKALFDSGQWLADEHLRQIKTIEVADFCYRYVLRNLENSRAVLKKLKSRYPLVLVSNFYGNIEAILKDFELDFFDAVIESAVVGVRKPDPEIYRLGVEAMGSEASDIIVIGDSYDKDIVPAKNVGCKTIWLKGQSWKKESVDESIPDVIVSDINQLIVLLIG